MENLLLSQTFLFPRNGEGKQNRKQLKLLLLNCILHGPSMFTVNAKIYGVIYKQASSIAFDETCSYWSAPKNS